MKLAKKAEENTTVKKNATTLKEGTPLEHSRKHFSNRVVGANVGITMNMGDYSSLRVDCWLTDEIKDNETPEDAYARVLGVIDKTLKSTVAYYSED